MSAKKNKNQCIISGENSTPDTHSKLSMDTVEYQDLFDACCSGDMKKAQDYINLLGTDFPRHQLALHSCINACIENNQLEVLTLILDQNIPLEFESTFSAFSSNNFEAIKILEHYFPNFIFQYPGFLFCSESEEMFKFLLTRYGEHLVKMTVEYEENRRFKHVEQLKYFLKKHNLRKKMDSQNF